MVWRIVAEMLFDRIAVGFLTRLKKKSAKLRQIYAHSKEKVQIADG